MLSLRQPFRANDHIVIGSEEGIVIRLTSRATILMTPDGNHLRIPNSTVFKAVILNYTRNPERRFGFVLGVDVEDDPLEAMHTGLEALRALPIILDGPDPKAIIESVGDSNIVLKFTAWVNQEETDFGTGRSLGIREVKEALEASGFTLPEPVYRLRIDQNSLVFPNGTVSVSEASAQTGRSKKEGSNRDKAEEPETLDTRPDTHLLEKAEEERVQSGEDDLLDKERPVE